MRGSLSGGNNKGAVSRVQPCVNQATNSSIHCLIEPYVGIVAVPVKPMALPANKPEKAGTTASSGLTQKLVPSSNVVNVLVAILDE